MSLIITLTASMLTCSLIAPDQTILPQLQVDDGMRLTKALPAQLGCAMEQGPT